MSIRKAFLVFIPLVALATVLVAKDFWEEPFTKWKRDQVVKMLGDSPWSQTQIFTSAIGKNATGATTEKGSMAGQQEIEHRLTVRFLSAKPIREALVRFNQIAMNYDSMDEEKRKDVDTRLGGLLNADVSDKIIVAVELKTNDPNVVRDFSQFLDTARTETLKQSVYLISDRLGRVDLKEYIPPSPRMPGAKFIFPRSVNDKPLVTPDDKELKFDMWVPSVNQRLFVTFKPAKMVYRGDLSL